MCTGYAPRCDINPRADRRLQRTLAQGSDCLQSNEILQVENSLPLEVRRGPALKPVWFAMKYTKGSLVPEIELLESSGNNSVDQMVLKGMSSYRFSL